MSKKTPNGWMGLVPSPAPGHLIKPPPPIPTGRVSSFIFPLVRGGLEVCVVPMGRICSVIFPLVRGGLEVYVTSIANSIGRICSATIR